MVVKTDLSCRSGECMAILVVEDTTGFIYKFQTGGYACNHPSAEGFLLPFDISKEDWLVTDEDDFPDRLPSYGLKLDETREGEEAWWPVKLTSNSQLPLWLREHRLWLTYENSD